MEVKAALISSLGRTILGNDILTIGRDADNGLVIRDPTVSRHHAQIRPDGQGYAIIDLRSVNGTFVNGQRLTGNVPRLLHSGDTFRIGDVTFTYAESWRDNTDASFHVFKSPLSGSAPSSLPPTCLRRASDKILCSCLYTPRCPVVPLRRWASGQILFSCLHILMFPRLGTPAQIQIPPTVYLSLSFRCLRTFPWSIYNLRLFILEPLL